jgi:transcriptional regulator of met regulon
MSTNISLPAPGSKTTTIQLHSDDVTRDKLNFKHTFKHEIKITMFLHSEYVTRNKLNFRHAFKQKIKITMFLTCLYKNPLPSTSSCMIASCSATRKCQETQHNIPHTTVNS